MADGLDKASAFHRPPVVMRRGDPGGAYARVEDFAALIVVALMAALPSISVVGRELFGETIPGAIPVVQHLTLIATFIGAAQAARSERHLAISSTDFMAAAWRFRLHVLTSTMSAAIVSLLVVASVQLVMVDFEYGDVIAWGVPLWCISLVMPVAFAIIALRMVWLSASDLRGRLLPTCALFAPLVFVWLPDGVHAITAVAIVTTIVLCTLSGMPIFTMIAGIALVSFWLEGTPISAVPGEAYRMTTSPMLPAIPLFTVAGYILAEGGASRRLLRLFQSTFGWLPGGLAIVTTLLLAFFTPLTGASGITILAMGGVLLPMMLAANYPKDHALGLVTVSGSIGVMFPPSLPVILYAYYAEIPLDELFIAGVIPGILLVLSVAAWGAYGGMKAPRSAFDAREAVRALWHAKWDVLLPVAVLAGIFGGYTTLVETAALSVVYALIIECVVFRGLSVTRDIPRVVTESSTLVGGFMIILCVALGLTSYLVIAQVPIRALHWIREVIQSPILFLLVVNVLLIVVGALMDIYSAIIVFVPLIAPMALAYGVEPVHLGVIFLVNMQLGYLMPPMGENLFLSAYRFKERLPYIYRCTIPYVFILLVVVLVVTYVPSLSLWLVSVFS